MATMVMAPDRSYDQRMRALVRANKVRSYRKTLKADVKAGRCGIVPLLTRVPVALESMRVHDLLLALPGWGIVKVREGLVGVGDQP